MVNEFLRTGCEEEKEKRRREEKERGKIYKPISRRIIQNFDNVMKNLQLDFILEAYTKIAKMLEYQL